MYFSADDLIADVKMEFISRGKQFPGGNAEYEIRKRFEFRIPYEEMERRRREDQQIADMIGSGNIYRSISDEIIDDLNRPEIMGIDVSEFSTQRETVVPPEIVRYAQREASRPSQFVQRIKTWFGRLINR